MSKIRSVNDFPNYDKIFGKKNKKVKNVIWICKECGCDCVCEVICPYDTCKPKWVKKEEKE